MPISHGYNCVMTEAPIDTQRTCEFAALAFLFIAVLVLRMVQSAEELLLAGSLLACSVGFAIRAIRLNASKTSAGIALVLAIDLVILGFVIWVSIDIKDSWYHLSLERELRSPLPH